LWVDLHVTEIGTIDMFDIGGGELLFVLLIVVLLFGPKKLPELMQGLGRGMREFKKAQREFTDHINGAFEEEQRKSYRQTENNRVRREPDTIPRSLEPQAPGEYEAGVREAENAGAADAALMAPAQDTPVQDAPQGTMPRNAAPQNGTENGTIPTMPHDGSTENNDTNNGKA
jgi:TatA/E family protein of Tat protein translocase